MYTFKIIFSQNFINTTLGYFNKINTLTYLLYFISWTKVT